MLPKVKNYHLIFFADDIKDF